MNIGGLSKARLARMHDVMAGYVERGEMPGLVTLISRRGEVHVDAIGMKAGGRNDPMRRDTIFRIASMTKPITAAGGDDPGGGMQAAAGRAGGSAAARTGRPQGPEAHRRAARRHRAREAGDHLARPAHLPHGLRHDDGAAGHLSDPKGDDRGRDHHGTEVGLTARARRMDPALRHAAADASAGREVDVQYRLRRAGRADRARLRASRWRHSFASAYSSRSA